MRCEVVPRSGGHDRAGGAARPAVSAGGCELVRGRSQPKRRAPRARRGGHQRFNRGLAFATRIPDAATPRRRA